MADLDAAEGVPDHYSRTDVEVTLHDGSMCSAIAYVAQPWRVAEGLVPSPAYLQHLVKGARYYVLPADYLRSSGIKDS